MTHTKQQTTHQTPTTKASETGPEQTPLEFLESGCSSPAIVQLEDMPEWERMTFFLNNNNNNNEKSRDIPWRSDNNILQILEGLPLIAVQFGSVLPVHCGGSALL